MKSRNKRLLVLSVGYGQGHHSAAAALAEYYIGRGWNARIVDICEKTHPFCFRLTQWFYDCCVRVLPWLWRITYDLTDTADWRRLIKVPLLRRLTTCLHELLGSYEPDLIICTYPLYAYMLDELRMNGVIVPPYVMVVTDAREISRPWMCSAAQLVIVPDAGSRAKVIERYALAEEQVIAAGFPVRAGFVPSGTLAPPAAGKLRILYGAYRQLPGVVNDIRALMAAFPGLHLTVLAGRRATALKRILSEEAGAGDLQILSATEQMAEYMKRSHLYIGKAGAATMFECYACQVPVLINYTLPGQEQGNLELLLEQACGCHVESTAHLISTVQWLLENEGRYWQQMRANMSRTAGALATKRIAEAIFKEFGI